MGSFEDGNEIFEVTVFGQGFCRKALPYVDDIKGIWAKGFIFLPIGIYGGYGGVGVVLVRSFFAVGTGRLLVPCPDVPLFEGSFGGFLPIFREIVEI